MGRFVSAQVARFEAAVKKLGLAAAFRETASQALQLADESQPPIVLLASGGSSGSHLLASLLAQREPFVSGPESNFASRPDLFNPSTYRPALLTGLLQADLVSPRLRLSNNRDFRVVPMKLFTDAESYLLTSVESQLALALGCDDWMTLMTVVRDQIVEQGMIPPSSVLLEHSPSTSVSLLSALTRYPALRAIHLVRDPRDVLASMLTRRQKAPAFSALPDEENLRISAHQYCLLTACALEAEHEPGYLRVSYEDLCTQPDRVLEQVVSHLGYDGARHRDSGPLLLGKNPKQSGWRSSPTSAPNRLSIGRYRQSLSSSLLRTLSTLSFTSEELGVTASVQQYIEKFGV